MKRTIFLDGQYLKVNGQMVEAFTPGVFQAQGVFETMLGLEGAVLDIDLHLKRLRSGLKRLGIKTPSIKPAVLNEVLRRNQLATGRVRLMVWHAGKQTHVLALALPYKMPADKNYKVCLIKAGRPANARSADIKSLDYRSFADAFAKARAQGFDEALLINSKGHISEASRSNIFWVQGKVLYTPPLSSGCLNGITRQQVIRQARLLKITVKERNLTPKVLGGADTAFLTNSLSGIKPIEVKKIRNITAD